VGPLAELVHNPGELADRRVNEARREGLRASGLDGDVAELCLHECLDPSEPVAFEVGQGRSLGVVRTVKGCPEAAVDMDTHYRRARIAPQLRSRRRRGCSAPRRWTTG
jgi:hypothetical protein